MDPHDDVSSSSRHGRLSYSPLVRAVVHGLRRRCGLHAKPLPPTSILVATSGGADSVALLRALHLLSQRRTWPLALTVAHVNHHLRPAEESDADEAFVASLASQLGLPFRLAHLHPAQQPGNVEAIARRLRYAALTDIARQCGAGYVVTAHHADDQLETLLMAILRGTTAQGLRGIAWRRRLADDITLLRPMLGATHDEAVAFLNQLSQPWREDATNADRGRTRARLRHDVLPVLRSLRPDAAKKAVRTSDAVRGMMKPEERKSRIAENPG